MNTRNNFKDTINKFNPNKDSGVIRCGNLCMESFSNTSPSKIETHTLEDGQIVRRVTPGDVHTCNLVSVVLSNLETNSDEEIEDVVEVGNGDYWLFGNDKELEYLDVSNERIINSGIDGDSLISGGLDWILYEKDNEVEFISSDVFKLENVNGELFFEIFHS